MDIRKRIVLMVIFLILFAPVFACTGCGNGAAQKDTAEIKQTIRSYYNAQYSSYSTLKYSDLTATLDMSSTPARNLEAYSRIITERRRYIAQKGYYDVSTEKYVFRLQYRDLKFTGDSSASITVDILPNDEKASPPWFVLPKSGDNGSNNVFTLKRKGDKWLIADYDFADARLQALREGKVVYDAAAIHKEIDAQYKQ